MSKIDLRSEKRSFEEYKTIYEQERNEQDKIAAWTAAVERFCGEATKMDSWAVKFVKILIPIFGLTVAWQAANIFFGVPDYGLLFASLGAMLGMFAALEIRHRPTLFLVLAIAMMFATALSVIYG